ncbi:MAG: hypothetical protein GX193_08845 [Clostridiales bacterium]|nr:hypothetical protein [Clostridiales bacterium]
MNHVDKSVKLLISILLSLFIILSGCTSNDSINDEAAKSGEDYANIHTDEKSDQQNGKEDDLADDSSILDEDISEDNISGVGEEVTATEKEAETEVKDEGKDIVEIIPMAQLPDLDMGPQKSYSVEDALGFRVGILTPIYHDTFRYHIREFKRARLVIDIGNTGSKTLVINDDSLYFSIMDTEGKEIAGSKVQGAPISITPGEVKRIVVTAENPDASAVCMDIGGLSYTLGGLYYRALPNEESDIVNTKPYKHGDVIYDDEGNPYTMAGMAWEVIGNEKAKVMVNGVLPVENEKIGPIDKGNGFLALVKVKIANTTGEDMTIDKILSDGAGEHVTFKPEDLAVLGEKTLPSTIKPNTIVEGWIPFRVGDGREGYGIVIYTSHGGFILNSIHAYAILNSY